jgi:Neu-associated kinase
MRIQRVGDYLLGEKLGEGSFAKVRVGLHVLSGEKVRLTYSLKGPSLLITIVNKVLIQENHFLKVVLDIHF